MNEMSCCNSSSMADDLPATSHPMQHADDRCVPHANKTIPDDLCRLQAMRELPKDAEMAYLGYCFPRTRENVSFMTQIVRLKTVLDSSGSSIQEGANFHSSDFKTKKA